MILLELFWVFLKIGTFSFGGGYGMIPLIKQEVIAQGWINEDTLINFIGISESTPGPIAVNLATFIGSSQGGFWGGMCATVGVVLPSFIIILIISKVLAKFKDNKYVKAVLDIVKPAIIGLILATGILITIENVIVNFNTFQNWSLDYRALIISLLLLIEIVLYKKIGKKKISPIVLIISSAAMGMLLYSFF